MIQPAEHNFNIYLGQHLKYPFIVWNDDEQTNAYDFTGHSVASQARASFDSSKSINLNASIEGNTIYLNATPAQLAQFVIQPNSKNSRYVYDIEVTKPDGTKWTIVRGMIEAYPEVTKI